MTAETRLALPTLRREWPLTGLDVEGLGARGWRPVPFQEFVLKVQSRCNLSCDYCYVYEMADQRWRAQPARMQERTVEATAARIAEHARAHGLPRVKVVLHGGEPLLAGPRRLAEIATTLRRTAEPVHVEIGLQTNGTLLREQTLDTLLEHEILVGVSIDGAPDDHDRHRRRPDGGGTYAAVSAALDLLRRPPYRAVFSGLLCTVDVRTDPVETYERLLLFEPPNVDLLLPHGNWSRPPPERGQTSPFTPYSDWLIAVFDRWYSAAEWTTGIRLFEEILHLALGGSSRSESIGLSPVGLVVIETDGTIEQVDALKAAYEGAAATGLDVFSHSFDTALGHPGFVARQIGVEALSDDCRACVVRDVCGGGHYAHRYRAGRGFREPSVYCPDLYKLVDHVRRRVHADVLALARA